MSNHEQLQIIRSADVTWAVDLTEDVTGDQLIGQLKSIRGDIEHNRMLVVSGGVRIGPDDDYDTLGALAAAVIRLRVDQFVGLGLPTKALATQVGLEGSWDGESLWLESVTDAYDYLRVWPEPGDLVVVSGYPEPAVIELVERIEAWAK